MSYSGEQRGAIRYDIIMIAVILMLTLLGLVTLFSASYLFALNQPGRFARGITPLFGNIVAFGAMVFIFPILALFDLDWLKKGWVVVSLVVVTLILNILPFFPPFKGDNAAMRWIIIKDGIGFQPSELIKIVLPLYLAYILDKNNEKINSLFYGPLPPFVITGIYCALVYKQSNFSDAIFIAMIGLLVCFISGLRFRFFILALLLLLPFLYKVTYGNPDGIRYQRIQSYLSKDESPSYARTQLDISEEAIKSGGFWGKGIGQGTWKVSVPEVHGDFVFASFVEESGFLGVLIYLILIGVFAFVGFTVAWQNKSRFIQFFTFGLITPIVIQTLMNIAVVARIIPTTGVPLPFISSGGSSLLITLAGSALLFNMTRRHVRSEAAGGQNAR